MKVRTLIDELSKLDPEINVTAHYNGIFDDTNGNNILFVTHNDKERYAYLECNCDCDVTSQIVARFNEVHEDELHCGESVESIYEDLYNHGIAVSEVKTACDEETASAYENFIKEYDTAHDIVKHTYINKS